MQYLGYSCGAEMKRGSEHKGRLIFSPGKTSLPGVFVTLLFATIEVQTESRGREGQFGLMVQKNVAHHGGESMTAHEVWFVVTTRKLRISVLSLFFHSYSVWEASPQMET